METYGTLVIYILACMGSTKHGKQFKLVRVVSHHSISYTNAVKEVEEHKTLVDNHREYYYSFIPEKISL